MKKFLVMKSKIVLTFILLLGIQKSFENFPPQSDLLSFELNRWVSVEATVYHSDPRQCEGDHTITASGHRIRNPKKDRIIAVSRDLEKILDLDVKSGKDKVEIKGTGDPNLDGEWWVRDRMNKRWRKKVDLLVDKDYVNRWKEIKIRKIN